MAAKKWGDRCSFSADERLRIIRAADGVSQLATKSGCVGRAPEPAPAAAGVPPPLADDFRRFFSMDADGESAAGMRAFAISRSRTRRAADGVSTGGTNPAGTSSSPLAAIAMRTFGIVPGNGGTPAQ